MDAATGFIVQGGALQYANGKNLVEALRERMGLPTSIQNDARCAALAEIACGELQRVTDGVMVVIGTGVGGALMSGGKLITGGSGAAGELSMLAVRPLRQEGMGGLLGNRAGMRGLLAAAAERLGRESLTGEELIALVNEGDPTATSALDEGLADLADALLSLQFLLDPQRFVIGGGISADATYMEHLISAYEAAFATPPPSGRCMPRWCPRASATMRTCWVPWCISSRSQGSNVVRGRRTEWRRQCQSSPTTSARSSRKATTSATKG